MRVSTVLGTSLLNVLKAFLVLICILLIGVSVVAVQVVDYVVGETQNDDNVLDLEHIKLNETGYILALNGENPNAAAENDWVEYQELIGPENRIWVSLEDGVPNDLMNAVVATEDREFYDHHGVNFRRTAYALANELFSFSDNSFGASTIEQQLVKNITGEGLGGNMSEGKDGYQRKLREIFRAWGLDNNYSKDMIMEAYLNTMPLSERIAGMQAGALEYFNKDVKDLTLSECATIAGITRAPTYYSPYQNPDNCLTRRNNVLGFMLEENYITRQQYEEAKAEELHVTRRTTKDESGESRVIFNYFSDTVFNAVVEDMVEQQVRGVTTRSEAIEELYTGGYRIYATVEDKVQSTLEDIYLDGYNPETGYFLDWNRFPGYENSLTRYNEAGEPVLPQSAAAVINYDGALVGVIGGIGEKTGSLGLNRAVGTVKYDSAGEPYVHGTVRQVGSTMKMVAAYPVALEKGIITYSTGVINGPVLAVDSPVPNWPTNYGEDPGNNQPMPVAAAVSVSANTVAARVGSWVTAEDMYEFATETLQVSSLVGADLPTNDVGLAPMVLGAMTYGMSAYELAGAYMMYGGNDTYGVYNSLHCYTKVEDSKGNIVLQPERTTVQAVDPATGYVGNRLLSNVLRDVGLGVLPTALGMAPAGDMDSVAKTGTTTDDNDRWLVGLTPYYVTAVWWGYDANNVANAWGQRQTLQGWPTSPYTNVTTNVWKTLMETVQEGKEYKEFPAVPANVVTDYFCTSSGALASPGCPAMLGYYNAEHMPDYCPGHARPDTEGDDEDGEAGEGGDEGGGEAEG